MFKTIVTDEFIAANLVPKGVAEDYLSADETFREAVKTDVISEMHVMMIDYAGKADYMAMAKFFVECYPGYINGAYRHQLKLLTETA